MDSVSQQRRSEIMRLVRSKHTGPEMVVRRLVHGAGYRYRLHVKGLPGQPDLVFRNRRKVIFVHGCFWHRHRNCALARLPKSNRDFWLAKLEANRKRDVLIQRALRRAGWRVLTIWECELPKLRHVEVRIRRFLNA